MHILFCGQVLQCMSGCGVPLNGFYLAKWTVQQGLLSLPSVANAAGAIPLDAMPRSCESETNHSISRSINLYTLSLAAI